MLKLLPNALLCRTAKEGFGYKQECMSPDFRIVGESSLQCAQCGKVYNRAELTEINFERRASING